MSDPLVGRGATPSVYRTLRLIALVGATVWQVPPPAPDVQPAGVSVQATSPAPHGPKGPYRDKADYLPVDTSKLVSAASEAGATLLRNIRITRWKHDLGIVEILSEHPVAFRWHGAGEAGITDPGVLVVDVRDDRTLVVRVASDSTDLLLRISEADIQVWELHAARPDALAALDAWQPAPTTHVDEETVAGLRAGQADRPPWMQAIVERLLAHPTPADAAIAHGVLVRLGPPAGRLSLDELLAAPPAWQAGVDWLAAQAPSTLADIERDLIHRSAALTDDFDRIVEYLAAEMPRERLEALVIRWLHRRDDLECGAYLFEKLGKGEGVRAALAERDAAIRAHATALSEIGPLSDDDRLAAVSWQEPDSWWGLFAVAGLEGDDAPDGAA